MSVLEAWRLPLVAAGIGFHLSVSWALLWRYVQARERSLLTWGLAWLVLTLHVIGMFLTDMGYEGSAPVLRDVTFAGAALAFLGGQVEREGQAYRSLHRALYVAGALVSALFLLGLTMERSLETMAASVVAICLGLAAYLASPRRQKRAGLSSWLLFLGYATGSLHAMAYTLPTPLAHSAAAEIIGHSLFSLLFSAAVTWQSWEQQRAIRLFSATLERLNRPLSIGETLDQSLRLVADLLGVSQGWVLLRSEGRGEPDEGWSIAATHGFPPWAGPEGREPFPIDRCLCLGQTRRDRLETSIQDIACVRASCEAGHPAGRHLTIPLGSDGKVQGIMSLLVPPGRVFTLTDREMLTALGEQIGLAIDRSRLYDELRAKEAARGRLLARLITAQEDERRRIARELHDETGQALTALVVNLDFLVRHPAEGGSLPSRLAEVRDMAEATLAEVRRVIHEMRPTVLDDLGLETAVRWLAKRYAASGLRISVEAKGLSGRLPDRVEITAFRLVQEACTNTVKHAGASSLRVELHQQEERLHVTVADDGRGISPRRGAKGMGLAGLEERVGLVGGTLTIRSTPGAGTLIHAELPLEGAIDDGDTSADLRRPHDGPPGRSDGAAVGVRH